MSRDSYGKIISEADVKEIACLAARRINIEFFVKTQRYMMMDTDSDLYASMTRDIQSKLQQVELTDSQITHLSGSNNFMKTVIGEFYRNRDGFDVNTGAGCDPSGMIGLYYKAMTMKSLQFIGKFISPDSRGTLYCVDGINFDKVSVKDVILLVRKVIQAEQKLPELEEALNELYDFDNPQTKILRKPRGLAASLFSNGADNPQGRDTTSWKQAVEGVMDLATEKGSAPGADQILGRMEELVRTGRAVDPDDAAAAESSLSAHGGRRLRPGDAQDSSEDEGEELQTNGGFGSGA